MAYMRIAVDHTAAIAALAASEADSDRKLMSNSGIRELLRSSLEVLPAKIIRYLATNR